MTTLITQTDSRGITTITLNRPEVHNAFDANLIQALNNVLQAIHSDTETRVVIIAANGKSFSAGADLNWMKSMINFSVEENRADAEKLAQLMHSLYYLNKPTIAMVHGAAMGGGIGLIACCDIVLATADTQFCFSEVKLGLTPAVISPYIIAAIGPRATKRYFLTAESFNAVEALELGLVHEIVDEENKIETLENILNYLLKNSPQAMSATKELIAAVANKPLNESIIQETAKRIAEIRVSEEGQEGLHSFFEKRKPKWIMEQ